ncbi:MAG: RsmD family RNA methyltransferase [bacterium]
MFLRITGGKIKGKRINFNFCPGLRPTSSAHVIILFDILGSGVLNCRFLDLFAGTGRVGFEALSRGADEAVFVEKNRTLCRLIQDTGNNLGFKNRMRIMSINAFNSLKELCDSSYFDIIYMDPPYSSDLNIEYSDLLPLLSMEGVAVQAHSKHFSPVKLIADDFRLLQSRRKEIQY